MITIQQCIDRSASELLAVLLLILGLLYKALSRLTEAHSLNELTRTLNIVNDEIDTWKNTYEIKSLVNIDPNIDRDDLTGEDRRKRLESIEE